jgi:hypothetical protein
VLGVRDIRITTTNRILGLSAYGMCAGAARADKLEVVSNSSDVVRSSGPMAVLVWLAHRANPMAPHRDAAG